MKRARPAIGETYHIYNRGVEKRRVFLNDRDRLRFIYSLFAFNDNRLILNHNRMIEVGLPSLDNREKLVEIISFTLMPNHYHLALKQITENGITEFMRKIGTGYTNYFNLKYKRVGPLFQGKYKLAHVKNEKHFLYLPFYIHLNPLDLATKEWRRSRIKNIQKALEFLESYRWSSHLDYTGKENFPEILEQNLLKELFEGPEQYKKNLVEWLKTGELEEIEEIALEPID